MARSQEAEYEGKYDLLIKGGRVIDPGWPQYHKLQPADVAIRRGI